MTWRWVQGHVGHEQNERVDGLANAEAVKAAEEIGWTPASRFGFTAGSGTLSFTGRDQSVNLGCGCFDGR